MDEDALLNAEDLKPTPKAADDCEMAEGRKAELFCPKEKNIIFNFFIPWKLSTSAEILKSQRSSIFAFHITVDHSETARERKTWRNSEE
jgi:hypothetical protein